MNEYIVQGFVSDNCVNIYKEVHLQGGVKSKPMSSKKHHHKIVVKLSLGLDFS